ncbi:MAG: hypothetical protein HQL64_09550 [Magnetococcales bacterium]|nr:hypothetical protein [Magnetococcales bacterium]
MDRPTRFQPYPARLPHQRTVGPEGGVAFRQPVPRYDPWADAPPKSNSQYPILTTAAVTFAVALVGIWNGRTLSMEEGILGLVIVAFSFHSSSKWFTLRKKTMPFIEMYSLIVGLYYGLPMVIGTNGAFSRFTVNYDNRIKTGLVVLASIIISLVACSWSKSLVKNNPKPVASKEIPHETAVLIFQTFLVLSTVYNIMFQIGLIQPYLGNYQAVMNILLTNVMGMVSSYVLSRMAGENKLSKKQTAFMLVFILISTLVIISGLMLVSVVLWIFPGILGFTLGRGRIPFRMIVIIGVAFTLLSVGKGTARTIYWGSQISSVSDIYQRLTDWANISLQSFQSNTETSSFMLADRMNFSGVLGMVIQRTPEEVPFIEGTTYAMLPSMIVPRFLWPEKPDGHAATIYLGIHYGVHTIDEIIMTSIGIGLLGEAYANFGFFGVVVFSGIFGWILGYAHRIDLHASPLSMRSFSLVGLLTSITKIEYALVEIAIPLVQIVVMLFVIYGWLVRRRRSHPQ